MAALDDKSPAPPPPPKPTPKTSTVPLKKETVRITLRAKPPSGDTATVPSVGPMQRSAGEDDATATAPVGTDDATATAPVAAAAAPAPPGGAKTIPLAKAPPAPGGARPPVGAKTIPLAKAPGAPAMAGAAATVRAGSKTTPLQPAASGAVKPLPKATVQLQKTQPMVGGSPTAAFQRGPATGIGSATALSASDETDEETGIMPYALIVLLLAIIVLAIELLTKFTPS